MNRTQLIKAVKSLNLSQNDFIVIGSGTLAALDIREVTDVDLIVSEPIFKSFEDSGDWNRKEFPDDESYYLVSGLFEVGLDWDSQDSKPNLAELKGDEISIDDVPFASLKRVKAWKLKKNTPKHLADVKLIDEYLAKNMPFQNPARKG